MNRLTIDQNLMCFMDGDEPFAQKGTLTWPLFGEYMNKGESYVSAIMDDRLSVGANTIAVAGMWSRHPGLHPSNPKYWESLRPFCQLALDKGLRIQWVVLMSTADTISGRPVEWLGETKPWPGMPDPQVQKAHWERFIVTLGDFPNVTFVLANQPGHRDQPLSDEFLMSFEVPQVGDFPKMLAARNNPNETENPIMPPLDFSCYCSSRKPVQGLAELGASLWYTVWGWADQKKWSGTKQVSILFEPPRVEEGEVWADPARWRQMGRSLCMKGTGGGNFYSTQDRFALPLTGVVRACAVEFLGNIPKP